MFKIFSYVAAVGITWTTVVLFASKSKTFTIHSLCLSLTEQTTAAQTTTEVLTTTTLAETTAFPPTTATAPATSAVQTTTVQLTTTHQITTTMKPTTTTVASDGHNSHTVTIYGSIYRHKIAGHEKMQFTITPFQVSLTIYFVCNFY